MKILFTICGRAGSKGIKNKNIRMFCGKYLVHYSISAIEEKVLKILFSIGVGITTQCFTVAIALIIIAFKFKYPLGYVIATAFGLIALLILFTKMLE